MCVIAMVAELTGSSALRSPFLAFTAVRHTWCLQTTTLHPWRVLAKPGLIFLDRILGKFQTRPRGWLLNEFI